jgi:ferritin-like metal-binding protein YciE
MTVYTVEKLFIEELKDLHSAETQITKTLPKLIEAASSTELKHAFEHHLRETKGQIQRLCALCAPAAFLLKRTSKGGSAA